MNARYRRFGALLGLAVLTLGMVGTPRAATPVLPRDSVYHLQATLTDQAGRARPWASLAGRPRVVSMFYTSCQYVCPLIVDAGTLIYKKPN